MQCSGQEQWQRLNGRYITMNLHLLNGRQAKGYTTFGSVYLPGEVKRDSVFSLANENGQGVPLQSRITAYWPDGSVKWASHTADAERIGKSAQLCILPEAENWPLWAAPFCDDSENSVTVCGEKLSAVFPVGASLPADYLMDLKDNESSLSVKVYPVMLIERRENAEFSGTHTVSMFRGEITEMQLVEAGPLQTLICCKGVYRKESDPTETRMRFSIAVYFWKDKGECRFVHTFLFDGDEQKDFLKGLGLCFETELGGYTWNRHVKFGTEKGVFHEAAMHLFSSHPRIAHETYLSQMRGQSLNEEVDKAMPQAVKELPVWQRYALSQLSTENYIVRKRTKPGCCHLTCERGKRANGTMAISGENGSLLFGVKDFWQKYPSGLSVDGLGETVSSAFVWFYSPETEAYDFRHYDTRSYQQTLYEGFEYVNASPVGIAVTSECRVKLNRDLPSGEEMRLFATETQHPPIYTAEPSYYHEKQAFGLWSLPAEENMASYTERLIERELKKAFEFYRDEVCAREWYGLFDYGDVMHKYDSVRHTWRYDMGGFAWQNTELVPTYWLWFYFLRTGNSEVFDLAEAMSRHCSEVDIYHFGYMQGLGTRHNVRHWGCSCKEPRIAMAGHYRFYYYLTGDYRTGEVLRESLNAEYALAMQPRADVKRSETGEIIYASERSGPDWTSYIANWMCEYERTLHKKWLQRTLAGLKDISNTPFGLASGPEFYMDMNSGHLSYIGESETSGNMHLQVCQGGTEIWFELMKVLEGVDGFENVLPKLLADYGAFYPLTPEEKEKITNGRISLRPFAFPYFAGALSAYAARTRGDDMLAVRTVAALLGALFNENDLSGFTKVQYKNDGSGSVMYEIPWISTNFTSQWCLNIIVALEFIRGFLPKSENELIQLLTDYPSENFHGA